MPGPAPKPDGQRRRRNATIAMTRLPAAGRAGDPPPWPLPPAGDGCVALWAQLWATPQAAVWERAGWTRVVARYCLLLLQAEEALSGVLLGEVRQLEDRLGLSPMAMLRLRWEVTSDEVQEARASRTSAGPARRRRLRAVDADAASSSG